jgi:uncharacterized protein CbrC (UPF0167 family)
MFGPDAHMTASRVFEQLQAIGGIETSAPKQLIAEIERVLADYERRAAEVTQAAIARGRDYQSRRQARTAEARATAVALGDRATDQLLETVSATLLDSEYVAELYAEDAVVAQLARASLLMFVDRIETEALGTMRAASTAPRKPVEPPRPRTLADEGFPFPLFDAPAEDAVLDDAGSCRACNASAEVRFASTCYACFRAGKAAHTIDTELGMVRTEDAARGETHGRPVGDDETPRRWRRFAVEDLVELTRTPNYSTWQGESWLFCCRRPMVFEGAVRGHELAALGEPAQVLADLLELDVSDPTIDAILSGSASGYRFRCGTCRARRGHWERA